MIIGDWAVDAVEDNIDAGIYLTTSSGNTVSSNLASGNTIGIYLDTTNNSNTLSGNKAFRNIGHGVALTSSSGNTLTGNSIYHNGTVYESHQGLLIIGNSNNNIVDANDSFDNITWGIIVGSNSSNNTISNNSVYNNRKSGFVLNCF